MPSGAASPHLRRGIASSFDPRNSIETGQDFLEQIVCAQCWRALRRSANKECVANAVCKLSGFDLTECTSDQRRTFESR